MWWGQLAEFKSKHQSGGEKERGREGVVLLTKVKIIDRMPSSLLLFETSLWDFGSVFATSQLHYHSNGPTDFFLCVYAKLHMHFGTSSHGQSEGSELFRGGAADGAGKRAKIAWEKCLFCEACTAQTGTFSFEQTLLMVPFSDFEHNCWWPLGLSSDDFTICWSTRIFTYNHLSQNSTQNRKHTVNSSGGEESGVRG